MSGQVDVGWAAPPDGLDQLDRGEIRIITNGNAASIFKDQTVRVLVTTAQTIAARRDVVTRFMRAYRETARWLYSDDAALQVYADWLGMSLAKARRTRDEFFPWAVARPRHHRRARRADARRGRDEVHRRAARQAAARRADRAAAQ